MKTSINLILQQSGSQYVCDKLKSKSWFNNLKPGVIEHNKQEDGSSCCIHDIEVILSVYAFFFQYMTSKNILKNFRNDFYKIVFFLSSFF